MKKLFILFLSALLCLQTGLCVWAVNYERELYSVQLPDDYDWVQEESYISDNGSTFSVTCSDNTEEKLCIADMSEKDIAEYTGEIERLSSEAMAAFGREGKIEIVSSEKVEHPNGKTALVTVCRTGAKSGDGTTVRLQKIYEFTGVNNKFTFTYTAVEEELIDDLDDAFASIVVNEAEIDSRWDKVGSAALFGGMIILICLGIYRFMAKPAPKKKK